MSRGVDHEQKTPVNSSRVTDSLRQFIIDECVICGERHAHGARDATVATGGRAARSAHCHGVDGPGQYYLQLAPDAEPPERWYRWIDREFSVEVAP